MWTIQITDNGTKYYFGRVFATYNIFSATHFHTFQEAEEVIQQLLHDKKTSIILLDRYYYPIEDQELIHKKKIDEGSNKCFG